MRESFKNRLGEFNEIAKQEIVDNQEINDDELQQLLERFSQQDNSNIDTQAEIFELQKEKQRIMQEFKEESREKKEGQTEVIFKNNKFYTISEDGLEIEITKGEILTDGDWGIEYYLNPNSVPKNLRRRYLLEQTKRKLRNLLKIFFVMDKYNYNYGNLIKKNKFEILKIIDSLKRKLNNNYLFQDFNILDELENNFIFENHKSFFYNIIIISEMLCSYIIFSYIT